MLKAALDKIADSVEAPDENDQLGDLELEDAEEEAHDDDETVEAAVEGWTSNQVKNSKHFLL